MNGAFAVLLVWLGMPTVLVGTPVSGTHQPYTFAEGLSIERLPNILWDKAIVKGFISDGERRSLERAEYWLCARKEVEHVYAPTIGDDLMEKVTYGAWALQIICPIGASHIFLLFHDSPEGYDNIGSRHGRPLLNTLMGRLASREDIGLARYFDAVYSGINRAFSEKIIRIVNPVMLLEHSMQADNLYISTLLSVMALDMLFMAGQIKPFVARLNGFLGFSTHVLPVDSIYKCQPTPTVGEVVSDVYDFRNVIAHGQRIPKTPYRQPYDLRCTDGQKITDDQQPYHYAELMQEAARFLLTSSLLKIFSDNLVDLLQDDKQWGFQMNLYEHRYNNAAPPKVKKTRGR